MKQAHLLLRAHRPTLLRNLARFLALTPIAVFFAIAFDFIRLAMRVGPNTPAQGIPSALYLAVSDNMFLITVVLAAAATLLQPVTGFQRALAKLPIPVTARQLAYVPLATTLAHWLVAQALLHVVLLFGWLLTGLGDPVAATLDVLAALPLGLFFVLLVSRSASNAAHTSQI